MNAELRAWLETPFAGYAYSYPLYQQVKFATLFCKCLQALSLL